jgi:hypothetical protein
MSDNYDVTELMACNRLLEEKNRIKLGFKKFEVLIFSRKIPCYSID